MARISLSTLAFYASRAAALVVAATLAACADDVNVQSDADSGPDVALQTDVAGGSDVAQQPDSKANSDTADSAVAVDATPGEDAGTDANDATAPGDVTATGDAAGTSDAAGDADAAGDVGATDAATEPGDADAQGADATVADVDAGSDAQAADGDASPDSGCTISTCDDANPCTDDACDAKNGCVHTNNAASCSDGNACTVGDVCAASTCKAGVNSLPCDDGNACTDDSCVAVGGCKHTSNAASCSDANPCTLSDACAGGVCVPGTATMTCDDGNACTADACDPQTGSCNHIASLAPCDDGNACTVSDVCGDLGCAGTLDCTCAINAGQTLPFYDNCNTPFDDNCDGKINEASTCGATIYKYSAAPECSFVCYYDELHDIAVSGSATDTSGFATYAAGQLFDGIKGSDDWSADLGSGPAYEWVAWSVPKQVIVVQFPKPRDVALVRIGMNNAQSGDVIQAPEIDVRMSADGVNWSTKQVFMTGSATEPKIPAGKRGDVTLTLPLQVAKFVEISFVTPATWTFVDELAFD